MINIIFMNYHVFFSGYDKKCIYWSRVLFQRIKFDNLTPYRGMFICPNPSPTQRTLPMVRRINPIRMIGVTVSHDNLNTPIWLAVSSMFVQVYLMITIIQWFHPKILEHKIPCLTLWNIVRSDNQRLIIIQAPFAMKVIDIWITADGLTKFLIRWLHLVNWFRKTLSPVKKQTSRIVKKLHRPLQRFFKLNRWKWIRANCRIVRTLYENLCGLFLRAILKSLPNIDRQRNLNPHSWGSQSSQFHKGRLHWFGSQQFAQSQCRL